jgi:hypothetical protein
MPNGSDHSPPPDVCLLLRAHAEARWLSAEVVPVLRELERDDIPAEQLGAALAYVEVLWIEARSRAAETDAARADLDTVGPHGEQALHSNARRYHVAVRRLRTTIYRRIERLVATRSEGSGVLADP